MNEFKPKLRGNTFMILLLRAVKTEVSSRPIWTKKASGLTRATFFESLIKVMVPRYKAQNNKTLTKYIPEYLVGTRPYSRTQYPFNDAQFITKAKSRLRNNGSLALSAMKKFCNDYLDLEPANLELLIGGIIETVLLDDSFDGIFFTGKKWIKKDLLEQETHYNLHAFLLMCLVSDNHEISQCRRS